jgi:hypothetical protein
MSQHDQGHGSTTNYATPRDAKAQAKAEKAYRKASRPWFKKKRIWALAIILLIVLASCLSNMGGGSSTNASNTNKADDAPTSTETSTTAADAFPGAQPSDVVGDAGATLTLGQVEVTSTGISEGDATLGSTLCSTATVVNNSDETIQFSSMDWKLQAPSGTILNAGFAGSDNILNTGEIAPGGTSTGDVCFDAQTTEAGQYVVIYEPVFSFFSDRGAWLNTR